MKYLVLLFVGVFIQNCLGPSTSSMNSSSNPHAGKYAAFLDSAEMIVDEKYHYVVTKFADGTYVKRVFYPERKTLTSKEIYSDRKLTIKNGLSLIYYDFGELKSKGIYKNNVRVGDWEYYELDHGKIQSKGTYDEEGKFSGEWTFYKEGIKKKVISYKDGVENGNFQLFDSLGTVVNFGVYQDGEIISQDNEEFSLKKDTFIVEGSPYLAECHGIEDMEARYKCSTENLLSYVYSNLRYPRKAREYEIEGQALFQFIVNKEGNVVDIKTIHGLSSDIERECLRILSKLPKWKPGIQDGKVIKVKYTLPIRFKLED